MFDIEEPPWLKELDDDRLLNSSDVRNIFGIDHGCCINKLIEQKAIPAPMDINKRGNYKPDEKFWKVADLRRLFKS
mgnify:CR=1 FL=1